MLDGTELGSGSDFREGLIAASQLLPDTAHTIEVRDYGGVALAYRID